VEEGLDGLVRCVAEAPAARGEGAQEHLHFGGGR
jgi:hypothetical protein